MAGLTIGEAMGMIQKAQDSAHWEDRIEQARLEGRREVLREVIEVVRWFRYWSHNNRKFDPSSKKPSAIETRMRHQCYRTAAKEIEKRWPEVLQALDAGKEQE